MCVKQPKRTQVSLESMTQIAVRSTDQLSVTFEVTYEILRNGEVIATINDEMDYAKPGGLEDFRHTNFPNFPIVDNNPRAGINKYDLRCTFESGTGVRNIFATSRSLKVTGR
ncbi:hypothetical protein [Chengkuizengella sediminis]|uniref:hypothetical protein n=1 Tax=Chengkuizengella sediminis TaxID=1885917 RepID=UPI001389EE1B|nr:hypothetical protein [Chengkuizengella sediminis]